MSNDNRMRCIFEETTGCMYAQNIDGTYLKLEHEEQFKGFKIAYERIERLRGTAIGDGLLQMMRQRAKGIEKYGDTIENFKGTALDLAQHAFEESCDQTVCLAELVGRLKKEATANAA